MGIRPADGTVGDRRELSVAGALRVVTIGRGPDQSVEVHRTGPGQGTHHPAEGPKLAARAGNAASVWGISLILLA